MAEGRRSVTSSALRSELSARNLARAARYAHETSFGRVTSVVYHGDEEGIHGNFLPAVYRRILANPLWSLRLQKSYTGSAWIPRSSERKRAELDCCTSSDALLMNVFCYPRVLQRPALCELLRIDKGTVPSFGVRAGLPMRKEETDRTEFDMQLDSLVIESKLSESGFGNASRERLLRYHNVEAVFEVNQLPWGPRGVSGYQIIRGALYALLHEGRYLLLVDERRSDLQEQWLRVLGAMHSSELRSRMLVLTWQELAARLPKVLQSFLESKYGIEAR